MSAELGAKIIKEPFKNNIKFKNLNLFIFPNSESSLPK